ncbi:MAG: single-stranded DNA-binding protein [Acidimicrobiales bacterium]
MDRLRPPFGSRPLPIRCKAQGVLRTASFGPVPLGSRPGCHRGIDPHWRCSNAQQQDQQHDQARHQPVTTDGHQSRGDSVNQAVLIGRLVYVEGRLQSRQWQATDGSTRRTVEIVANRLQALSSKSASEAPAA